MLGDCVGSVPLKVFPGVALQVAFRAATGASKGLGLLVNLRPFVQYLSTVKSLPAQMAQLSVPC